MINMKRHDLSNYLFHWVSGATQKDALDSLFSIIVDQRIIGSSDKIKGLYCCICFTETPIDHFTFDTNRYWPFGISVSKNYVFELGGRPVIYQSDSEYYDLPENLRWRHVRYEPTSKSPIDFTWEREWRILADEFILNPNNIQIIVPSEIVAKELEDQFNQYEWDRYYWECIGYGEDLASYPEPLIYSIKPIKDN
jgi:hypothetical protein